MKSRPLIAALSLVFLAGIIWLFAVSSGPPEPVYQGKRLTYWLSGYLARVNRTPSTGITISVADPAARAAANAAVQQAGTNAIPTLLRLMRARDSVTKTRILRWLIQHPRIANLFGGTPFNDARTKNNEAYFAFLRLGPTALPAVPELDQIYEASLDTERASEVLLILPYLGPNDAGTVSALLFGATNSTDEFNRYPAFRTLGSLHAQPEIAVPALVNLLGNPSAETRADALMTLGMYGANAMPALPALTNLLNDPDLMVRMTATNAIIAITAASPAAKQPSP